MLQDLRDVLHFTSKTFFDKELFPIIIQEKIKSLPSTRGFKDPLQIWHDFILDCSLMAGAIIYDGLGNKKDILKTN